MTDLLISIGVYITRIVVPLLIVVGTVGNLLNVAVLVRPVFYPHACSHYLLAAAINNVFYSSAVLIYQLVVTGYQIDPSQLSVYICKVMVFAFHLSAFISPYIIAFASMERYFASSTHVHLRRLSSVRISHWTITCTVIFLILFNLNIFIFTTADPNNGVGCYIPDDTVYNQILGIVQALAYAAVVPVLMIIFGYLMMRNLRQVHVLPVVISKRRRTERQLARMLILQVIVYIVVNVPIAITYLIAFLPVAFKITPTFSLIYTISQTMAYTFNSTSFLAYILSTPSYREECIIIVKKIFRIPIPANHRVVIQTNTRNQPHHTLTITLGNQQHKRIEPAVTHQEHITLT